MVPRRLRSRWLVGVEHWGRVGLGSGRWEIRAVTGWALGDQEVPDLGGQRPGSSHTPATDCSVTLGKLSLAWALDFHV